MGTHLGAAPLLDPSRARVGFMVIAPFYGVLLLVGMAIFMAA